MEADLAHGQLLNAIGGLDAVKRMARVPLQLLPRDLTYIARLDLLPSGPRLGSLPLLGPGQLSCVLKFFHMFCEKHARRGRQL